MRGHNVQEVERSTSRSLFRLSPRQNQFHYLVRLESTIGGTVCDVRPQFPIAEPPKPTTNLKYPHHAARLRDILRAE
jgi:hypothetical protein